MHRLYAGTYRYGHRQTDQRRKKPGRPETGRVVVEPDQYHALIHNHCPAYNDLPSLWRAPTTSPSDRQRIIRLLVERVEINVQGTTDRVDATVYWSGGFNSHHELVRPLSGYEGTAGCGEGGRVS